MEDISAPVRRGERAGHIIFDFLIIVPLLTVLLLSLADAGNAILIGRKLQSAVHAVAETLPQHGAISRYALSGAVNAGRVVMSPYDTEPLGLDIMASRQDGVNKVPVQLWRETVNLAAFGPGYLPGMKKTPEEWPDAGAVVRISVVYRYEPLLLKPFGKAFALRHSLVGPAEGGPFIELQAGQMLRHVSRGG